MLTPFCVPIAYPLTGSVQRGGPVARKTEHFPVGPGGCVGVFSSLVGIVG